MQHWYKCCVLSVFRKSQLFLCCLYSLKFVIRKSTESHVEEFTCTQIIYEHTEHKSMPIQYFFFALSQSWSSPVFYASLWDVFHVRWPKIWFFEAFATFLGPGALISVPRFFYFSWAHWVVGVPRERPTRLNIQLCSSQVDKLGKSDNWIWKKNPLSSIRLVKC